MAGSAFWSARARHSIDLLGLRPGMRALDARCRGGDGARAMAAAVAPGGEVVGLAADRDEAQRARRATRTDEPVSFRVGRVDAPPFARDEFDAVRCDRGLADVRDLGRALGELIRIARPGAAVVAVEADWDTLRVDAEPFEVTLAVCRRRADAVRQPRAGRELPEALAAAGFERVAAQADTGVISSAATAEARLGLEAAAAELAARGELGADEVQRWLADLRERDDGGRFEATLTYVTARGFAPGG